MNHRDEGSFPPIDIEPKFQRQDHAAADTEQGPTTDEVTQYFASEKNEEENHPELRT
jgi:hypothetical protein